MKNVFETLATLHLSFELYEHPAVYTVEEAKKLNIGADFGETKNLFLRNRKGSKHYLVTFEGFKKLNMNALAELLGEDKLLFASAERLMKYLGLTPGSVSPFGLINDTEAHVTFVLDNDLLKHEKVGIHPNTNTQTVVLDTKDFQTFLSSRKNTVLLTDL